MDRTGLLAGCAPAVLALLVLGGCGGKAVFEKTCSRCHSLPLDKVHTAEEWKAIVERMAGHAEKQGKPIPPRDREKVLSHLLKTQVP